MLKKDRKFKGGLHRWNAKHRKNKAINGNDVVRFTNVATSANEVALIDARLSSTSGGITVCTCDSEDFSLDSTMVLSSRFRTRAMFEKRRGMSECLRLKCKGLALRRVNITKNSHVKLRRINIVILTEFTSYKIFHIIQI